MDLVGSTGRTLSAFGKRLLLYLNSCDTLIKLLNQYSSVRDHFDRKTTYMGGKNQNFSYFCAP